MKEELAILDETREVREKLLLASLPPEYPFDLTHQIEEELKVAPKEMVVYLEDDSTGVQSSHDVYLITDYSKEAIRSGIRAAIEAEHRLVFILTNSRALSIKRAEALNRDIARTLAEIAQEMGIKLRVGSRSDSTLRGHFPLEPLTLKKTLEKLLGIEYDGTIVSHAFLTEMSRITVHGVHYLRVRKEDGSLWYRPVHLTRFAEDTRFGYPTSNMAKYIAFKFSSSGLGEIKAEDVLHINIEDVRNGGPQKVKRKLMGARNGRFVVVDVITHRDLQVFVSGLLMAEREGKNFLYRSAASLPPARVNMKDVGVLSAEEILGTKSLEGILCIWGSFVELSNKQLQAVLGQTPDLVAIPFHVNRVLDSVEEREKEVALAKEKVESTFGKRKHALVYTVPRTEYPEKKLKNEERAANQQRIADALQDVYNRITVYLDLVIFKGGTTSSIGLFGSETKRVYVLGQVDRGIPIVKILPQDNERFPGKEMLMILGPGNVGVTDTYVKIIEKLTGKK